VKKVLFVASVVKKHIMVFHLPYLEWFKNNGYEVHVCANNDYENKEECNIPFCDEFYELPFERSPLKKENILAYKKVKTLINQNKYDIIHCHTPIGGALGRLAAKNAKRNGAKVIYTAHGFHFFNGASYKHWLIYYPVEKLLSKYTDILITINQEDYDAAINKKFKAKKVALVNGVGINLEKFQPQIEEKKLSLREKYGYSANDFILMYAGELSYRKHQDLLINVASKLKDRIPNLKILLAGNGDLEEQYLKQIAYLDVHNQVELLGFRKDIDNLMNLADLAVSASRQEGLPVNVMEAMATGLPLVVTDCRGNRDLVTDNENGFVVGIDDIEKFADSVEKLHKSKELRVKFGEKSLENIKRYSLDNVLKEMGDIYTSTISNSI
jgi:glycosyltransferase EpsD